MTKVQLSIWLCIIIINLSNCLVTSKVYAQQVHGVIVLLIACYSACLLYKLEKHMKLPNTEKKNPAE